MQRPSFVWIRFSMGAITWAVWASLTAAFAHMARPFHMDASVQRFWGDPGRAFLGWCTSKRHLGKPRYAWRSTPGLLFYSFRRAGLGRKRACCVGHGVFGSGITCAWCQVSGCFPVPLFYLDVFVLLPKCPRTGYLIASCMFGYSNDSQHGTHGQHETDQWFSWHPLACLPKHLLLWSKKIQAFPLFCWHRRCFQKKTHTSPREALPWSLQGTPIQKSLL